MNAHDALEIFLADFNIHSKVENFYFLFYFKLINFKLKTAKLKSDQLVKKV